MVTGPTDRFERGHSLQGIVSGDIEDHRVPGRCRNGVTVAPYTFTAEVGPGVVWRILPCPHNLRGRCQPLQASRSFQAQGQPSVGPDIGVLEVDQFQSRGIPLQRVPTSVCVQQTPLGHPIHAIGRQPRILTKIRQHPIPARQDVHGLGVDSGDRIPLTQGNGSIKVDTLNLQRGHSPAIAEREEMGEAGVMGHLVDLSDGVGERQPLRHRLRLDESQNQGC